MPGPDRDHLQLIVQVRRVNYSETPLNFDCCGETLLGIQTVPEVTKSVGIVIIVGGPQYRVGSHRQFVILARRLAADGYAVLRFDYRGMGDSGGSPRAFDEIDEDIEAAISALCASVPALTGVALWGLCDAASAVAIYASRRDDRVRGLILLNPWVRSEEGMAKVQIKHHYRARLTDPAFWKKLAQGRVDLLGAARGVGQAIWHVGRGRWRTRTSASAKTDPLRSFQERMVDGLRGFQLPALLILSGRDLTAREFCDLVGNDSDWRELIQRKNVQREELPDADHTFSNHEGCAKVEKLTLEWLALCK